jgi:DNA end-binding protein Ku
MPRANWSTTVSCGLVTFGIKAYTAARNSTPGLKMLHEKCGAPINKVDRCTPCDEILTADSIVKAFEKSKGEFVRLTKDEIASIAPESSNVMNIEAFVPLEAVDPINYDKSYWIGPDDNAAARKAYKTLFEAMQNKGKCALVQWVDHKHDKIGILRATYDGLIIQEIFYEDEIDSFSEAVGLDVQSIYTKEEEVRLLEQLIDINSGDFEKTRATFQDGAITRLRALVDAKSGGKAAPVFGLPQKQQATNDLSAAILASLAAAAKKKDLAKAAPEKPAAVIAPAVTPEKKSAPKGKRKSA